MEEHDSQSMAPDDDECEETDTRHTHEMKSPTASINKPKPRPLSTYELD